MGGPNASATAALLQKTLTSISSCAELSVLVFVTMNPALYGCGPSTFVPTDVETGTTAANMRRCGGGGRSVGESGWAVGSTQ